LNITDLATRLPETEELIAFLKKQDDLMESFDESIFSLIRKDHVKSKLEIAFRLINGLELRKSSERKGLNGAKTYALWL
jgi:hypothetical protein